VAYATSDMVSKRLQMLDATEHADIISEFLTAAHAEVVAVLRRYGLDPDSVDSDSTDYELLQAAEADVAAGLAVESIPGEHDKSTAQERHLLYLRGMANVEAWASARADEAEGSSGFRVKLQRSKPATRRDFYEYLY